VRFRHCYFKVETVFKDKKKSYDYFCARPWPSLGYWHRLSREFDTVVKPVTRLVKGKIQVEMRVVPNPYGWEDQYDEKK